MHTRKVQSVGGGTYTVSLPKEWADSHDVSTGDAVNLHSHVDGILAIQPGEPEADPPRTVTVDLAGSGPAAIERVVRAAYAAGTKELCLDAPAGFGADESRALDRVTRNLTGVSVVEESETTRRVRILLDSQEVSVRQSVRQLAFVALSMHRDATAGLSTAGDFDTVPDRDDQADRLFAIVDRSFGRALTRLDEVDALATTRPELFALWLTARELERVADHAEAIATERTRVDESATPPPGEIATVAGDAREVVDDAVGVVVGDAAGAGAREILQHRDAVRRQIETLDSRLAGTASGPSVRRVLARLRRTAEHGGNIAELGLRTAIREGDLSGTDDGSESRDPESRPTTEN